MLIRAIRPAFSYFSQWLPKEEALAAGERLSAFEHCHAMLLACDALATLRRRLCEGGWGQRAGACGLARCRHARLKPWTPSLACMWACALFCFWAY